jgi:hypothetical protein
VADEADNEWDVDEKAIAASFGPSELQIDEIESLKEFGWMDSEGNWVPKGTKLPPYKRKYFAPPDAPVYKMSFQDEAEAAERARLIESSVDVKHEIIRNGDSTYSIVQIRPSNDEPSST